MLGTLKVLLIGDCGRLSAGEVVRLRKGLLDERLGLGSRSDGSVGFGPKMVSLCCGFHIQGTMRIGRSVRCCSSRDEPKRDDNKRKGGMVICASRWVLLELSAYQK